MSGCFRGARTSWTARTTTAIDPLVVRRGARAAPDVHLSEVMPAKVASLLPLVLVLSTVLTAQREHTRPKEAGTAVSASQASDLTLTLSTASLRLVQTWIRTAGTIDKSGKVLTAALAGHEAQLVKVGQRLRAFPPSSKSSMYQAYVTRVVQTPDGAAVEASLSGTGRANTSRYVMEIVVERGP